MNSGNQSNDKIRLGYELKKPPHSIESEQAVIGGCMLQDDAYWEIAGLIHVDDFYLTQHRVLFQAILDLVEKDQPRDIVTLTDMLTRDGTLEKAGGMLYVGTICKDVPSAANIKAYAQIVSEYSWARRAISIMEDGIGRLYSLEPPAETVSATQAQLESTARGIKPGKTFRQVLAKTVDLIERNRDHMLGGKLPGVPYGLGIIDQVTGGMRSPQLIAVAGRPSLGKTAFTHQIAMRAAEAGYAAGEISLEMADEQLGIRSFANKFKVNGTRLMLGHDEQVTQTLQGLTEHHKFPDIPLFVDSDTYDYHMIVARIVEWRRKHNLQVVFIDHIGLIRLDGFSSKVDRLGFITNNLKRLAKRIEIPIVIVCQLNRAAEKDKRRPVLSDFRDCGEIEQDIDVGIFLHSEASDEDAEIDIEIGLLKHRDGRRGWLADGQRFQFHKAFQTFQQVPGNIHGGKS